MFWFNNPLVAFMGCLGFRDHKLKTPANEVTDKSVSDFPNSYCHTMRALYHYAKALFFYNYYI